MARSEVPNQGPDKNQDKQKKFEQFMAGVKVVNRICEALEIDWEKVSDETVETLDKAIVEGFDTFDEADFGKMEITLKNKTGAKRTLTIDFKKVRSNEPVALTLTREQHEQLWSLLSFGSGQEEKVEKPAQKADAIVDEVEVTKEVQTEETEEEEADPEQQFQEYLEEWEGRYEEMEPEDFGEVFVNILKQAKEMIPQDILEKIQTAAKEGEILSGKEVAESFDDATKEILEQVMSERITEFLDTAGVPEDERMTIMNELAGALKDQAAEKRADSQLEEATKAQTVHKMTEEEKEEWLTENPEHADFLEEEID